LDLPDPGLKETIMNHPTPPLSRDAVILAIKTIVRDALHLETGPAEMADDTRLDTLGLDSLNIVDILLGMERAFDVAFDEADLDFSILESVSTLADFVLASKST
jgi:acyl carrier protein